MRTSDPFYMLVIKATLMGTGNIIPGVSGGTIALVVGIYEEFIHSLKRVNLKALKLLFKGEFAEFNNYVNGRFLLAMMLGIILSVVLIAQLFEFLFREYPIFIWSLFFGLILGSVYFIGRNVEFWNRTTKFWLVLGLIISISFAFLPPALENRAWWYVLICGAVSISGMTLPGISGSFLLILMGNYELLLINAVTDLDIPLLSLFILGSVLGLIGLSNLLAYILEKRRDETMATLTGFVLGSTLIIWPWQKPVKSAINDRGEEIVLLYKRYWPGLSDASTWIAILVMLVGLALIFGLEFSAKRKES